MDQWIKKDYRSLAPRIGIIYQNPAEAVSHRLNVFEIVAEPLRIQEPGLDKEQTRSRVLSALGDVHLSTAPEFLKRYPHELNMGAIQRLCLARALVHRPSLLVADEPTSSLDPSVQAKVLKMLLELQTEKGMTMLFITHDIGLARKVGDRIGVMLSGRLLELGPSARIINRPGHPYTKLLLDSARGLDPIMPPQGPRTAPESEACPFAGRCSRYGSHCREPMASAADLDSGRHLVWCHHPHKQTENQSAAASDGRCRTLGIRGLLNRPLSKEEIMSCALSPELIQKTTDFHGHWCPGLALGIRAAEWALNELGKAGDEEIVALVETDMCGVDAIQFLTGCTFGKGQPDL